jgi:hypothetical protein
MSLEQWLVLLGWTFKPTTLSLLVILGPLVLLIILLTTFRVKAPKIAGAWAALGQRWLVIGLGIFLCALITWFIGAMLSGRYDREYANNLFESFKKMEKRDLKEQVRSLTDEMERNTLADFIKDYSDQLNGDQRIKFLHAFYSTNLKKSITIVYQPLFWTPGKIAEFQKSHDKNLPLIATSGLEYDEHQKKLFKANKLKELNKSLNPAQWKFIRNQFIDPLGRDPLVELLTHLCDTQEATQADSMLKKLFEENFAERGEAAQMAWYADSPESEDTFAFLLEYIRWLRELPELLIWSIIGLTIALIGSRIKRQGRKKLFKV